MTQVARGNREEPEVGCFESPVPSTTSARGWRPVNIRMHPNSGAAWPFTRSYLTLRLACRRPLRLSFQMGRADNARALALDVVDPGWQLAEAGAASEAEPGQVAQLAAETLLELGERGAPVET